MNELGSRNRVQKSALAWHAILTGSTSECQYLHHDRRGDCVGINLTARKILDFTCFSLSVIM